MTYQEIVTKTLSREGKVEETKLTSSVVCTKFGVSRASTTRKSSVLSTLKSGHAKGEFVKCINNKNNKIYWMLGPGKANEIRTIIDDDLVETSSDKSLLRVAKENVGRLEKLLINICSKALSATYGDKWIYECSSEYIRKQLVTRFEKNNSNPWVPGKYKELAELANISDFADIISNRWTEGFRDIFKNKYIAVGKLEELAEYRNTLTHNPESLSKKELVFFNAAVDLFLEKFSIVKALV